MKDKILNIIKESKNILILSHQNPDGDAVGSTTAFYHALKNMNKNVDIMLIEVPKIMEFININNTINDNKEYDLAIVLDCSTKERIGQINNVFSKISNSICIDHHITNTNYCDLTYNLPKVSSCSQIVYYLLKEWQIPITKEIGESIMLGVLTDTNGFSNNNIDEFTFLLASELMQKGIDVHKIYSKVLRIKTKTQYLLHKIATERLEFYQNNKIAFTYITKEDFENIGALVGDHEGIVEIGRNIEGVEVSIFVREKDGYHFSLRSNGKVLVNKIASKFGGGGHEMASGGIINESFAKMKEMIINETINFLGE